jgi:hypothetical protein
MGFPRVCEDESSSSAEEEDSDFETSNYMWRNIVGKTAILLTLNDKIDKLQSGQSLKSTLRKCAYQIVQEQNIEAQVAFLSDLKKFVSIINPRLLVSLGDKLDNYFQKLHEIA